MAVVKPVQTALQRVFRILVTIMSAIDLCLFGPMSIELNMPDEPLVTQAPHIRGILPIFQGQNVFC